MFCRKCDSKLLCVCFPGGGCQAGVSVWCQGAGAGDCGHCRDRPGRLEKQHGVQRRYVKLQGGKEAAERRWRCSQHTGSNVRKLAKSNEHELAHFSSDMCIHKLQPFNPLFLSRGGCLRIKPSSLPHCQGDQLHTGSYSCNPQHPLNEAVLDGRFIDWSNIPKSTGWTSLISERFSPGYLG